MKSCAYCRSQIPDDALRCQYCTSWVEEQAASGGDKAQVVYVLDKDLVRFGKFAGAILGVMILVGIYLFGLDLKDTSKDVKTIREDVKTARDDVKAARDEVKTARDDAKATRETVKAEAAGVKAELDRARTEVQAIKKQVADQSAEAATAAEQAKSAVADIMQSRETVRGIVSQIDPATGTATSWIRIEMERHFERVLSADQFAKLRESLREGSGPPAVADARLTREEVLRLAQADAARAVAFFQRHGINARPLTVKIDADSSLPNAFWDGKAIVYGMGMVNGKMFGPYSPAIAMHEATHSLFTISYDGQSGSVSESMCDVIAALISGEWTVGNVRNPGGPSQFLRSLRAPGTAHDNPVLGKDTQPDHMSGFVPEGEPLTNTGILNKAAYLISEGGTHRGVDVGTGLGREKTAKLYMEVVKKLGTMKNQKVEFAQFKELVGRTSRDVFSAPADQRVVSESFRAVGL